MARAIKGLGENSRPRGVKKMAGSVLWRIRIGEYRVLFTISDRQRVVSVTEVVRRTTHTYD